MTELSPLRGPRIRRGFRLQWEAAQNAHVLLYPEGMVKLNRSAGEILSRCTGELSVEQIAADLQQAFSRDDLLQDVRDFLACESARLDRSVLVITPATIGPPLWLLLELTYRCPLQCAFCYNPIDFAQTQDELCTDDWLRVLHEARALGSVQLGLSGGEPLLRDDVELIAREAHELGFYSNLITSGVGLSEKRLAALKLAGLDHIQLSFQTSSRELNDFLSNTRTFELKRRVAKWIKAHDYPMVVNCVIHRLNIDRIGEIIALADEIGANYLELANAQYYSWAYLNREQLLPSRAQLTKAEHITHEWRQRLAGRMRILFVTPDYYETRPKRCMNGWGSTFMTITPDGTALPCHTAKMLPGLSFPNVRTSSIREIWHESDGFNRFRGTAWMKEPCASCDEREKDLGGCRCQALLLANDARAADPVCEKSPQHALVTRAVAHAERDVVREQPLIFRHRDTSRALTRD